MPHFLIDAGYFVGRMEKHWSKFSNKKNMRYWQNEYNAGRITPQERTKRIKQILKNDIGYIQMRIEEIGEIDSVVVCYDGIYGRRPRGKIYSKYKMNRSSVKAEEHKGIDIRKRIKKCGFNPDSLSDSWGAIYEDYAEADDLLAKQALELISDGEEVVVMSKDSDLKQVLAWGSKSRLHDFTKEISVEDFIEDYGIQPSQYIYYKTLVGDKSDNIPGIKGIGKSKAKTLIGKYPTIQDLPQKHFTESEWKDFHTYYALMSLPLGED